MFSFNVYNKWEATQWGDRQTNRLTKKVEIFTENLTQAIRYFGLKVIVCWRRRGCRNSGDEDVGGGGAISRISSIRMIIRDHHCELNH